MVIIKINLYAVVPVKIEQNLLDATLENNKKLRENNILRDIIQSETKNYKKILR